MEGRLETQGQSACIVKLHSKEEGKLWEKRVWILKYITHSCLSLLLGIYCAPVFPFYNGVAVIILVCMPLDICVITFTL